MEHILSQLHGKRVLLLYSGGLDGTYFLAKLSNLKKPPEKIFSLAVDIGGDLDLDFLKFACSKFNSELILEDKVDEFCTDFIQPSIIAQCVYLNNFPLSASISRPLIARVAFKTAVKNKCDAIYHTSTPEQNSMRRYNRAIEDLGFEGLFGSPYALQNPSRSTKMAYLENLGLRMTLSEISKDSNIWCREFEAGPLDDPERIQIPPYAYLWTKNHDKSIKMNIKLDFTKGRLTALNNKDYAFRECLSRLNITGGRAGLGRFIGLEEASTGKKYQEAREMPAAFILLDAYRRLEHGALSDSSIRKRIDISQTWVKEVSEGRWFGPLKQSCQAFLDRMAEHVSGSVEYLLERNSLELISLICNNPLYSRSRDSLD